MDSLIQKLNTLPKEVSRIYDLPDGLLELSKLIKEFNLNDDLRSKLIDISTRYFVKEISIAELAKEISSWKVLENKARELAIELIGRRLLIADKYFNGEVSNFLKLENIDLQRFASILKQQQQSLKELIDQENELAFLKTPPLTKPEYDYYAGEYDLDIPEERQNILNIFREGLLDILKAKGVDQDVFLWELNIELIHFLFNDQQFKQELVASLMSNEELLTDKKMTLTKELVPSISNWLTDFVTNVGDNEQISSLALSKYLSTSSSVQELDYEELFVLKRLLNTYKNIITFPKCLENVPELSWEIIPFVKEYINDKERTVLPSSTNIEVIEDQSQSKVVNSADPVTEKLKEMLLVHQETIKVLLPEDKLKLALEKASVLQGQKLVSAFWQVASQDLYQTVALLKKIILDNGLWQLWLSSPELKVYVAANLLNIYPSINLDQVGLGMASDGVILEIFKNIFNKLKLGDSQSAEVFSFAVSGNKRLSAFVYADLHEERFTWRKTELRGNELVVV